MTQPNRSAPADWPALPYDAWSETATTLHLYTQIAGKIRLVQSPWTNHSWHVPLYLTARGMSTSSIPYGARSFDMEFDFHDHRLVIRVDDGRSHEIGLEPRPVAEFYVRVFESLRALDIDIDIHRTPSEIAATCVPGVATGESTE